VITTPVPRVGELRDSDMEMVS